jgi:GNAT superfamily N-acetyltransferase
MPATNLWVMAFTVEFYDDPSTFLAAAGDLLAAQPVRSTVVASVTARHARTGGNRPAGAPAAWWVVVKDDTGAVVSAGMRTAPLPPYPPYFLAMPDDAARLIARTLHERGESVEVVNGYVPTIDVLAAETVSLSGGSAVETERTSLYELSDLVEPTGVPGQLRIARDDEVDLVQGWFDAFGPDASEQAGRDDPHPAIETRESTAARIAAGDVWIWETPDGTPAGVTAFNPTSFGVARIGPVFTPAERRGHGYAAAAVARISRRLLDEGARVCLFADIENRVSVGVYERLGYRPIARTGSLSITGPG